MKDHTDSDTIDWLEIEPKNKTGRKRKYDSNAARQKAYRQRKKLLGYKTKSIWVKKGE